MPTTGGAEVLRRTLDANAQKVLGVPAERILVVGQAPAVGTLYPLNYFTTIQAAINAGAALLPAPSVSNIVIVRIAPGTYVENVALAPFVYLVALQSEGPNAAFSASVLITGTLTRIAPAGAPDGFNTSLVSGIRISGTVTVDASAKTNGAAGGESVVFYQCYGAGAWNFTGRAAFPSFDIVYTTSSRVGNSGTWTDMAVSMFSSIGSGTITLAGNSAVTSGGTSRYAAVTLSGTSTFNADAGTTITGTLTCGAGCTSDVRLCKYNVLAGAGTIDRDLTLTAKVLAAGANAVVIAPPLPNALYAILPSQSAGAPQWPLCNTLTAAGFNVALVGAGGTYEGYVKRLQA